MSPIRGSVPESTEGHPDHRPLAGPTYTDCETGPPALPIPPDFHILWDHLVGPDLEYGSFTRVCFQAMDELEGLLAATLGPVDSQRRAAEDRLHECRKVPGEMKMVAIDQSGEVGGA